jgi:hypothetical protein
MMVIFFVIPDFEGLQKPFRVLLCLSFPIIYFALLIKKEISYLTLIPVIGTALLIALMAYRGILQSSFVNAWLCLFGVLCLNVLLFDLTKERKENLRYIFILAAISILVQFLIFKSNDGRPRMAYEINHSGAFLFLFFMAAEILGFRWGKLLVVVLSLFLLSRLLVFSIAIYYLIKFGKKYFSKAISKLNATWIALACFAFVSLFSFWYTYNIESKTVFEQGINRIVVINDDSSRDRFKNNTLALKEVFTLPPKPEALLGYGPVQNFIKATGASHMLHNELFDSIVQFGLLAVIFLAIFTLSAFNRLVSFTNVEYFVSLLFYSSILWVKYFLIPSPEMLFILFLLFIANTKYQPQEALQPTQKKVI